MESREAFEKWFLETHKHNTLEYDDTDNSYCYYEHQNAWLSWQAAIEYQKSETNYRQQLQVLQSAESERMYWVGRNEQKEKDAGICEREVRPCPKPFDHLTQGENIGCKRCAKAIREGE